MEKLKSNNKALIIIIVVSLLVILLSLFFIYLNEIYFFDRNKDYSYDRWSIVFINVIIFSVIGVSFFIPLKKRDWRTLGLYEAFIIALFTEMYGFPLTLFVLSSLFGVDLSFGHIQGHLLAVLIAETKVISLELAWSLVMIVSGVLIALAIILIYQGWKLIHSSKGELVTSGIYKRVRHPQYLGFILLILGLLIQWPTLISIIIGPILIINYYFLAKKEEKEAITSFGKNYLNYKKSTPMIFPFSIKNRQ